MTRTDFILIAKALKAAGEGCESYERNAAVGVQACISKLADALESTNPAFDRARFIAAATTGAKP